jgi:hypothetical protein
MAPQSKGGQELQTIEHYKGQFLNTPKFPCMFLYCYKEFKMICKTLGGAPITL